MIRIQQHISVSAAARALALTAALACASGGARAQTAPAAPVPAVIVALAEETQVSDSATFLGRAVATQKVDIRARVSGFVEERGFSEGAVVQEGAVLFRIEPEQYRAALEEVEAALSGAKAALALAELERDRQKELVARKAVAQAQLDRAEAEAASAAADVRRIGAQRDAAALNLSYTEVKAPFTGKVGLSSFDVGALIGPDSGTLLMLVRTDPMTVEFPVTERDLLAYRAGVESGSVSDVGTIELLLANGSPYDQTGEIDFTDVTVSPATDTVLVRAVFPNPDGLLRDGSLVKVRISNDAPLLSLTVPQQAVQRDLAGAYVLVVGADETVEQRRIEVDRLSGGRAIVASGLEPGERVITEGANKARPGLKVDAALDGEG